MLGVAMYTTIKTLWEKKASLKEDIKDSSQINYADNQAKIMKNNGNFEYCYNGQISEDSKNQIIVGQHLSQNENDKKKLKPAHKNIEKSTGSLPAVFYNRKIYKISAENCAANHKKIINA